MRSAIAPETIVAEVATKTAWKSQKVQILDSPLKSESHAISPPTQPPSDDPNISEKPSSKKEIIATQKSATFFITTLRQFFARTAPSSKRQKPACMKNTRAAQSSTNIPSVSARSSGSSPAISGVGSLLGTSAGGAMAPFPAISATPLSMRLRVSEIFSSWFEASCALARGRKETASKAMLILM